MFVIMVFRVVCNGFYGVVVAVVVVVVVVVVVAGGGGVVVVGMVVVFFKYIFRKIEVFFVF